MLWGIATLFFGILLIAGLLQTETVQNWAIDQITGYLNKNSDFRTQINRVTINWWDALSVSGLEIKDHQDSTMILAESAFIDFEVNSLLFGSGPTLDEIRIEQATIQLLTHAGDSTMNINRWTKELSSLFGSSSASKGSKFSIGRLELRQSAFTLANYNSDTISEGLDYNHMRFQKIQAQASDFYVDGDEIGIDLAFLSGIESNSGLEINEFRTDLTYNAELLEFDRLNLSTNKSSIKHFLRLEYASADAFSDFLNKVVVIADFDEASIGLQDLRFFVPNLPDIEDTLVLSGKVSGPLSDIRSEELLIRLGRRTEIFGAFRVDGLPDLENTYLNLSLKNSTIQARDLAPYLSRGLQHELQKLNIIRLNADFAGLPTRFTTNGEFQTSIGNLVGRVNYDLKNGVNQVVSNVVIQELDLGVLLEDPDLLQRLSLEGNVNIRGSNRDNLRLDLDAKIAQLGVLGYDYTNIETTATYGLDLFKGNLQIQDPNLQLLANGSIDLREGSEAIELKLSLDSANLDELKLAQEKTFIKGKVEMDIEGINIDELNGIARFSDLSIGFQDRYLELGDFYFQSLFAGGTRTMSLNSDYVVAGASGKFQLEQMAKDLPFLFQQYLSIITKEEPPVADLEEYFSVPYNLDLNVRLIDINPLLDLFQPDYRISKNTVIEGAFYQTEENTIFNFFTSLDTLQFRDNIARNVNIDFNTSKIINSEEILASFYIYSKEQHIGQDLDFSNFGFEAIWNDNALNLEFALDQDSTRSSARIDAVAEFTPNDTKISFQPSELIVLERNWNFDSLNQITLRQGEIGFRNVRIVSGEQEIDLEGKIGEGVEDSLNLSIQNVNVDLFNTFTAQEYEGTSDGNIYLRSSETGESLLDLTFGITDFQINQLPVGDLQTTAQLYDNQLEVNVENFLNGKRTIQMAGDIGLEEFDFNLDGELRDADLVSFEPFLSNYLSDMGGTVTGDLQLRGNARQPELTGRGKVNQGKFRIKFLNTPYQLDGSILFDPGQINFSQLTLKDINGNTASLNGGLTYQGLNDIILDIDSRMNNFQVLNTTARDNETFYGNAFVSGTLDIEGSTSNLDITARATSQPNTRIFIPLTSSDEQTSEDFIHFINIQDTARIQQISEDVNRLDIDNVRMNFILDITPDAYTEIIIDPRTEEKISGRGRGILTMNIDTQGLFTLSGTYEITEAMYNFSLYNVLRKEFTVEPGGRITWYGNPYEGVMNLTAKYTEQVSIQPLVARTSVSEQESSLTRRRFPVNVIMNLRGELLSPEFDFGFDFSQFPSSGEIQTAISAFQSRIANNEQEMNRQVFSVIMTRSFSPEGQFAGVNSFSNSLGQLLSSQLNSFLGQVDKNLEVNIDLASLDQNALETFQLSVAYTFLDGRLRVSRDGGFTGNNGQADAASIIGDWQAEYMITEDGVYRLRVFNRNNFNTFTSLSLSRNVATYGVSLSQNISFNSFSELFKKITQKQDQPDDLREDSDNYLRYKQEDWKPIKLDNIEDRLEKLHPKNEVKFPIKMKGK
ncbi:translocation/assembly module TamB domain-containing protein [Algoriphagus sp.]|uniref:translocation/assembly module TamB domain-containing protein n=1 Tax=Algoriphagus sp. TaxID=1872435 RepID=UPI0026118A45|nr:translocation/assembly module TamB domain-containing protein [Algoriphagus sp.]